MGYACQFHGSPSIVSAAGRLTVLTDPFVSSHFLCTVEIGNHNFISIQISPETLPGRDAGLRRRDGVGEGTSRIMYHLLTLMIRPQALIQP